MPSNQSQDFDPSRARLAGRLNHLNTLISDVNAHDQSIPELLETFQGLMVDLKGLASLKFSSSPQDRQLFKLGEGTLKLGVTKLFNFIGSTSLGPSVFATLMWMSEPVFEAFCAMRKHIDFDGKDHSWIVPTIRRCIARNIPALDDQSSPAVVERVARSLLPVFPFFDGAMKHLFDMGDGPGSLMELRMEGCSRPKPGEWDDTTAWWAWFYACVLLLGLIVLMIIGGIIAAIVAFFGGHFALAAGIVGSIIQGVAGGLR
jgi:hypothetical protein